MTAKELIEYLKQMPQDTNVYYLYDGEPRTDIDVCYLAKNGKVVLSDYGQIVHTEDCRPVGAPTRKEQQWYKMPDDPEFKNLFKIK